MATKRVVLHVGFHKTGTTALQYSLSANAEALGINGWVYPPTKKNKAHHQVAWAITSRVTGWKSHGGKSSDPRASKRFFRFIGKSDKNVVVSSEFFSELNLEQISELKRKLSNTDCQIVFTLRPISRILPSAYQQEVKNGAKANYVEWLTRIFSDKSNSGQLRFWSRHDHHLQVSKWVSVFGKKNVHLVISDEANHNFLIETFYSLLGISGNQIAPLEKNEINRSMTLEEIELIRNLNIDFNRDLGWMEYVSSIRSTFVREMTHSPAPGHSIGKLATPSQFKQQVVSKASDIVSGLIALDVNVYGDLFSLSKCEFGDFKSPTLIPISGLVGPILSRTRKKVLDSFTPTELVCYLVSRTLSHLRRQRRNLI